MFASGGATLYGSPRVGPPQLAHRRHRQTSTGKGYWLVGGDGGVFTFGDAGYFGSVPAVTTKKLAAPVVGMASTTDSKGYWLVGADGGI